MMNKIYVLLISFIIYENSLEPEVITYLSNDTLVIADNNYDGFSRVYVKQLNFADSISTTVLPSCSNCVKIYLYLFVYR